MKVPLLLLVLTIGARAATFPTGFEETEIAADLESPTGLGMAPDGRVFVLEQRGRVLVVKDGVLLPSPALQLDVNPLGERGLLGIAFHPQFATNNFVYLYYTFPSSPARNRISRFTVIGDTIQRTSETVILEIILGPSTIHNAGGLAFGPDGKLYVAIGENAVPSNAQSIDNLLGKILRLEPDGRVPADNPFPQATGINRAIWALGLRNPFSFSIQPGTGKMYINDVGQNSVEEINEGVAGANYGWPLTEGFSPRSDFRNPLYAYWHLSQGTECAITAGTFYNPPPGTPGIVHEFLGSYLFMDYCAGWLQRIPPGESEPVPVATGFSFPVALGTAADGSIYVLQRGSFADLQRSGSLRRVRYTGQQAPVITVQPRTQLVSAGQPVTFSVSVSGPGPIRYQWTRNGTAIPGATSASYTIAAAMLSDNASQFRLIATNEHGSQTSAAAVLSVTADRPPTASITLPASGVRYSAGDTISFAGTATDPETGALPGTAFTWRVDFHHDSHMHPFVPATSGETGGTFVVPRRGEWAATVFYRIHLTVTDSAGLSYSTFHDIHPHVVNITVRTNPPRLMATLDTWEREAPFTQPGVVGIERELSTRQIQQLGGLTYEFVNWSDGGGIAHSAITPASDVTYTANFRVATPGCTVSVSPSVVSVPAAGGTGSISLLTAPANCLWTAMEDAAWAEVFPINGTGPATVSWTIYPNYSTRQRSVTVQLGTGLLTLTQAPGTGTPDERFVGQLYSSFFGRAPSPDEVQFQVRNALAQGVSRTELTMRFLNSPEFADGGLFVAGLYMGLLRRDSEYTGWLFQRNAMSRGYVDREQLVANFINSPEFQLIYGDLSNAAFVTMLYQNILRRAPAPSELQYQMNALRMGLPRVRMAMVFLQSPEFRLNSGPRLLAFLAYATLLQRDASPGDLLLREQQIRATGSAAVVIGEVLRSPEFATILE